MDCSFYNPETSSAQSCIAEYVIADLDGIDGCDIVFAYLTSYLVYGGLAAEMGYAYAKGKTIIFVSDKGEVDGFLIGLSKWFCTTIEDGIKRLKKVVEK